MGLGATPQVYYEGVEGSGDGEDCEVDCFACKERLGISLSCGRAAFGFMSDFGVIRVRNVWVCERRRLYEPPRLVSIEEL